MFNIIPKKLLSDLLLNYLIKLYLPFAYIIINDYIIKNVLTLLLFNINYY